MTADRDLHDLLPPKLALVLRMRDEGATEREIADAVDTPLEGVPPLVKLAEAKLASLRERFADEPTFAIDQPEDVRTVEGRPPGPRDG